MQTKKYLYAAVGAQVSIAKAAQKRVEELRSKLSESSKSFTEDAQKQLDEWAGEGEEFVTKLSDSKAIDDLAARVDFDQMQTQVNKLRDQLEDLVATWRTNFTPGEKEVAEKVKVEVEETAAKAPAAKATAAKKPAAKTTAAKATAAKKPAAKTTAAKKPAAKKAPAAKTTTSTKGTAKKAS